MRLVAAAGPDGALHDFRLEQERAVGDDHLSGFEPPGDFNSVFPVDGPRLDSLRAVGGPLLGEEHEVGVLVTLDGGLGDHQRGVRLSNTDAGLAVLAGPKLALRVRNLGPDFSGPRLLIHPGTDPCDATGIARYLAR